MRKSYKNFNYKHSLGQNFIIDEFLLDDIVKESGINNSDYVLEIGPGNGAMTRVLCENSKFVVAIEIDKSLIPLLKSNLKEYKNISIINADFLNYDFQNIVNEFNNFNHNDKSQNPNDFSSKNDYVNQSQISDICKSHIKVVANLPYYITSPIIQNLLQNPYISEMTLMVQKEVAERIVATPSNKDYGILTLACNYFSQTEMLMIVSKDCFFPRPKVDSAVVKFKKHKEFCDLSNNFLLKQNESYEKLFNLIKASFAQRRKKLLNSLSNAGYDKLELQKAFIKLNFDENTRAENLSLNDYTNLSNAIN